ncbi:hypothetical protein BEH_07975 [Priestia filamentosa]|uniref:Nudix hydrolase domain-containing protein n=1 Tax=Priestia filamentosa TaxID=1402861 RepID=A0A0H4KGV9_9BACI|nr:NUDIX domain-containing protein [Priestia filamentosa]AKO92041.1 hypothetical protein BEH_07975 [Priestia filamentosa]
MGKMDEMILVSKRTVLFGENDELAFQGVNSSPDTVQHVTKQLSNNIEVMRRGDAEENTTYKQPIPYVVIKKGNQVFGYERLSGGGETRLHSQWSLGYGGHMNKTESDKFEDTLMTNLYRELEEELDIKFTGAELKPIGLINDDLNPVGEVHLGLLYTYELDSEATIEVREKDQIRGFWLDINELKNEETYTKLEAWSQFVADLLGGDKPD